ncbi:MAG TPA: muramoyltetrapeptide carboxypeptidase, partial [Leclercia adecarboxylata]|nr:muramoyltetrapeptide carboxypeptidase [Leclercia adecarboxylata]
GYDLATMIDYLRSRVSVPIISGLDFGHEQKTVTLPLGAQASLVHAAGKTCLTLSGHPVMKA